MGLGLGLGLGRRRWVASPLEVDLEHGVGVGLGHRPRRAVYVAGRRLDLRLRLVLPLLAHFGALSASNAAAGAAREKHGGDERE